jgi:hypothetical protein
MVQGLEQQPGDDADGQPDHQERDDDGDGAALVTGDLLVHDGLSPLGEVLQVPAGNPKALR